MTKPVEDLSSKKDLALGFFAAWSVRLPFCCLSLRLSMAMMLLHTRSSKPVSCETMMHVTLESDRGTPPPLDVHHVEVVRGLVHEQDVRVEAHRRHADFILHLAGNVTRFLAPFCISPKPTEMSMRSTTSSVTPAFLILGSARM